MDLVQPEQKRRWLDTPSNSQRWTTVPQPIPSQHSQMGPGPPQQYQHPSNMRRTEHPSFRHPQAHVQHLGAYQSDRRHHDQEPCIQAHQYPQHPLPARPPDGLPTQSPHQLPQPPQRHSTPGGHRLLPPHYHNERRYMILDGPPPMPVYASNTSRCPSPPPPMQQQQRPPSQAVTSESHRHPPHPDSSYVPTPYNDSSKKKSNRTSQACEKCRELKIKCDDTKPCKNCTESRIECVHRQPLVKPPDKVQTDILNGFTDLKKTFEDGLTWLHKRIDSLERSTGTPPPSTPNGGPDPSPEQAAESPLLHETSQTVYSPADDAQKACDVHLDAQKGENEEDGEDDAMVHPAPNVRTGDTHIPYHPTTSAGHLLSWSSIKKLTQNILERENIHPGDFPLRIEERRRTPMLYGRGDGHIEPDYGEKTVMKYIESCEADVLSLHPIISKSTLQDYARQLLDQTAHGTAKTSNSRGYTTFTSAANSAETSTGKRKRPQSDADIPSSPGARSEASSRGIEIAVALAALALGKLSLHRDSITSVDPLETKSSPIVRHDQARSPARTSPSAQSQYSRVISPLESGASRRHSGQTLGAGLPKSDPSYESLPGLEYLGPATEILGKQDGCPSIQYVQANILVALYYGQSGYVVKSLKYISNAFWALQVCIRDDLPRLEKIHERAVEKTGPPPKQTATDHILLMTFWTCLQLESDIVVELSLPQSGILSYTELIPYPDMRHSDYDQLVTTSYLAHLYIQKNRSYLSKTVYLENPSPKDVNGHKTATVSEMRASVRIEPEFGVSWLPPEYKFQESDPPPGNMLPARLRAKYWEFQVLCTRPSIKKVLDFSSQLKDGITPSPHSFNLDKIDAPCLATGMKSYDEIDPAITKFAKEGIIALIESTRAFHNIGVDRLRLTSVFSTAIAQWGNLLVLAACYRDPFLCKFVSKATLRSLFDSTISWISKAAHPSSSLVVAIRMLDELRKEI